MTDEAHAEATATHRASLVETAPLGELHGVLPTDPFLVLCVCVRDEADILDAFLAYHLSQGVDHILVTDHASQDSTREILDWYAANEAVAYFHQPGPRRYQGKWMTRMARLAARNGTSWIINADADEFWMPRCGTLRDLFHAVPERFSLLPAYPKDFLPPRSGSGFDFEAQTVWDASITGTYYTEALKPKMAHRANEQAVVHGGNHTITGIESGSIFGNHLIDILHFPVRSFEQFERKVAVRFLAPDGSMAAPGQLGTYPGQHHRQFNERRVSGDLRRDFDAWLARKTVDTGVSEGRLVIDDRLALHMRGLRALRAFAPVVSPAGFAQPDKPRSDEPPFLVKREVRLCESALRVHTRRIRGEIKQLRRTVKALQREARGVRKAQRSLLRAQRPSVKTEGVREESAQESRDQAASKDTRAARSGRRTWLPAWFKKASDTGRHNTRHRA